METRLSIHRFVGLHRPYRIRMGTTATNAGLRRPNMPYNPERHHRRSIRLPGYDYTQEGAYFVTLVTANRECLFGDVVDGRVVLSTYGKIAEWFWRDVPRHAKTVQLDAYMVMPNHVHAVLWIANVGATQTRRSLDSETSLQAEPCIPSTGSRGFASPLPASQLIL